MSLTDRMVRAVEQRIMSLSELDSLMDRAAYGLPSAAGRSVSVDSALQTSAVWACVRLISETIGSLPCVIYRRLPNGGKERNEDHRLYRVLHDQWNPELTAMQGWEWTMVCLLTWGNAFAQIVRDDVGVMELWPLNPQRVKIRRNPDTSLLEYHYRKTDNEDRVFAFSEIFHVSGLSLDAITGLSPIAYARQTIGLALALEEYGARYFGNGARPGGVLQVDGRLSDAAAKKLKASWEQAHAGTQQGHRVAVLEEGVKWQMMAFPNEDSQFLASREFGVEEIARWYRVPLHKIGSMKHASMRNIEQQNIEFGTDTIRPWLVRIEQVIRRDLFSITDGKRSHFAEFLMEGLLRGDLASRYSSYAIGRQWGWLSADDVRDKEDMNPLPDDQGKVYLFPLNMGPADQVKTAAVPDAVPGGLDDTGAGGENALSLTVSEPPPYTVEKIVTRDADGRITNVLEHHRPQPVTTNGVH